VLGLDIRFCWGNLRVIFYVVDIARQKQWKEQKIQGFFPFDYAQGQNDDREEGQLAAAPQIPTGRQTKVQG
jgi:hypothetical protein